MLLEGERIVDFKRQAAAAALFTALLIGSLAACKSADEQSESRNGTQTIRRGPTVYEIPASKDSDTVAKVQLQDMSPKQVRARLLESMQKDGYTALETKAQRLVFEKRACEPGPADPVERLSSKNIPPCDFSWLYIISDITPEGPLRRVRFDLAREGGEVQVIADAHYSFPEEPKIAPFRASDHELLDTWRVKVLLLEPQRASFGLTYQLIDADWARIKGFPKTAAALEATQSKAMKVWEVAAGGPAEAADLAEKDLITAIDGAPVRGNFEILLLTRRLPPGRSVALTIRRADEEMERTIVLGAPPAEKATQG